MKSDAYTRPSLETDPVGNQDNARLPNIHLWDYLTIVLQRLPLATAVLGGIVLLAILYTWTRTPRYRATSRILIERASVDLTSIKDAYDPLTGMGQREFVETQAKLITSRPVLEAVLQKANLLAIREFSRAKDPILHLAEMISVVPVRNTFLIDVSFEWKDPVQAALVVNTLVEAHMADERKRRTGISEDGLEELKRKAETLKGKVDAASKDLQNFMVVNKMLSLEKTQNVIVEKLRDLNQKLTQAQPVRMALQARVEAAEEALSKGQSAGSLPDVLSSPVINELKLELARVETEYSQLVQRLGENHPQLQAAATRIEALKTKIALEATSILTALRIQYEQAKREEALLQRALETHEEKVFRFNELAPQYNLLLGAQQSVENTYQTIIRRIEEIDINRMGGQGDNMFLISKATTPREKSWPNKLKIMLFALVLGLGSAVGLCFFLDYMDTTIRNDVDIRTHLRSSVLAAVPASSREIEDGATPDFVTQTHPRSHAAEAFRALRTALAFRLRNRPLRSLAISSTFPQEGKSVISINLAIAEAQVGKRTLLVDTDMRKPRLHLAFRVTAPTGIADWLSSTTQAPPQSLAIKTSIPNLFFLPCGTIPANPVELLDSPRFLELVKHLETHFDIVIFDSPPSFSLVDALVTAKALDGLLLVTRSFSTPKAPAQQVCDHMRDGGVTLLGVVLNNVDLPHHAYYYYGSGMHGKLLPYYEEPAPDPDHASKSIRGWFQGLFPTPRKPKE